MTRFRTNLENSCRPLLLIGVVGENAREGCCESGSWDTLWLGHFVGAIILISTPPFAFGWRARSDLYGKYAYIDEIVICFVWQSKKNSFPGLYPMLYCKGRDCLCDLIRYSSADGVLKLPSTPMVGRYLHIGNFRLNKKAKGRKNVSLY